VFVEETMAMLASSRPEVNSRGRKMDELELDEEFLKRYAELLKRWEETLAELAKVLGKDPRLLARYMNTSRRSADTLRDQLTLLHRRQEELLASLTQLKNEPRTDATKPSATAKAIQERLQQELLEIASQAAAIPEDFNTWLPAGVKADDQSIKALREDAARIATTATLAASAPQSPDKGPTSVQKVNELVTQLTKLEAALESRTSGAEPALTQHLRRRLAQVRKLEQQANVWTEKQDYIKANRLNRAIEVDQHRLSEETLALAGKLENLQAQLAGLPDEAAAQIQKMGTELTDGIKYDVLVAEMSAELGLRDGLLGVAGEQQRKAVDEFARAEERFDKLINRIIEEQDKVPAQVPDIDQIQLATLEDLLARLEAEPDFGDLLGVPDRMINLQQFRDWLGRSRGSGGGSKGSSGRRRSPQSMADRAREQARLAEQARRNALRAVQNAQKTAPKQTTRMAAHWNTLGSRLEDAVRQGRGNTPPRQYRQPIERYFELISRSPNVSEGADPTPKKPTTPTPPTAAQGGDTNSGTAP
jgi:type II secretory pathway pseudopilin PulG